MRSLQGPSRSSSSPVGRCFARRWLVRYGSSGFLVLGLFRGPGCGSSASSGAFNAGDDEPSASTEPPRSAEDGTTNFAEDAGAPAPPPFRGNPLCRVTGDTCMPDDDGLRTGSGTQSCAEPSTDAGVANGPACRLARSTSQAVEPTCLAGKQRGSDGTTCQTGADCAPGFDCVEGGGALQCRHYCCQDSCTGASAQSGGATFCDIQKLVDTSEIAPVCMPLKPCTLLAANQCATEETCAVVTPGGATGCVATGKANAGESCDATHCSAGLTCVGQVGTRRCYQLCKVGEDGACAEGHVCKTSTVFSDPSFGVCQKPPPGM